MQYSLTNILLLMVLVAGAIGVCQWQWDASDSHYELVFCFYCMLLATITAGAICQKEMSIRRIWVGMAVFGWIYLVLELRGPLGLDTFDASFQLRKAVALGIALLPLSGLLTHLWLSLFSGKLPTK